MQSTLLYHDDDDVDCDLIFDLALERIPPSPDLSGAESRVAARPGWVMWLDLARETSLMGRMQFRSARGQGRARGGRGEGDNFISAVIPPFRGGVLALSSALATREDGPPFNSPNHYD